MTKGTNIHQSGPHGKIAHGIAKPKNFKKTIIRLAKTLKPYRNQLIIVTICILINAAANILVTSSIKTLIDNYIKPLVGAVNPNFSKLLSAILIIAAICIVGVVCGYIYARLMINVSQGTLKNIRDNMYTHMEKLPIKYFDNNTHGNLMSRYTNDVDALRQLLSQSLPHLISSVITASGVFIVMLIYSWQLTIAVVLAFGSIIFTVKIIGGKSSKHFKQQQLSIGSLNGYIEEMIEGQKVVKVFSHEKEATQKFDEINEKLFKDSSLAHGYANMLVPLIVNISYLLYALVAIVGGVLSVKTSFISIGGLISFLLLTRSFTMPINQLTQQINAIVAAIAGAERIFEVIDEPIETDDGYITLVKATYDDQGNLIEADIPKTDTIWCWKDIRKNINALSELKGNVQFFDVTFAYDQKPVLKNVNLYANPGQKIAFVGSTGAGKTTITNLINRFYDIQQGKIIYDGFDVKEIQKSALRKSLGIVLQDTHLFTGTVTENIRYGRLDASDEEVFVAAKLANADFFISHLPQGYNTVLSGDGANLSQGQRQLLAIARAAVADPPVLILDEATSSVDTRTEKIIERGMDKLMEGRTVFIIAHRLSTVRNSNAIIVLENGEIIERGNHDELLKNNGKYYQLYTGAFELD